MCLLLETYYQQPLRGSVHLEANPYTYRKFKKQLTTQNGTKPSITQRLRTDLGRSVRVTTVIPLVRSNRFTGTTPSCMVKIMIMQVAYIGKTCNILRTDMLDTDICKRVYLLKISKKTYTIILALICNKMQQCKREIQNIVIPLLLSLYIISI